MSDTKNLKKLGAKTIYAFNAPDPKILETFQNQHPENLYLINLQCREFTSICPKTGQPDWGKFTIRYVPDKRCVESKSLKLYLLSFRNHGEFHEDVTNRIANDLNKLMKPLYLQIYGEFNSRGGISINPFVEIWNKKNSKSEQNIEKLLRHSLK